MSNDILGLAGKVALVTGGSRGIGRAVAEIFAEHGASVAINYVHDAKAATSVVTKAQEHGVKAVAIQADVSKIAEADRLVKETVEQLGRVDFVICNAGIWGGDAVEAITEELWDKTIEINLKGTWTVCRAVVPFMKRQKFGRIVIVSSTAGQRGEANVSNYSAASAAGH